MSSDASQDHDHGSPHQGGHDHAAHRGHEPAAAHEHAGDDHGHDHGEHEHEHEHEPSYEEQILAFRAGKDEFFRTADQSPIPHAQRHHYPGLRYFAPDARYRIEGLHLEPDPDPTNTAEIVTSDGKTREAWRVGTFEFDVPGGHGRLTGYSFEPGPVEEVFIPYRDSTSGPVTYGAGRYLDLEPEDDGSYALDFNLAYNPWCAYAPQYSCPLPPPENWLALAIEAGEQIPVEG
jgi:uncharacterized protein (DUF1684 family)